MSNSLNEGQVRVRLTLEVNYDLQGESAENMQYLLERSVNSMIGNGGLSGDSMAEVDEYQVKTEIIPFEVELQDKQRPIMRP